MEFRLFRLVATILCLNSVQLVITSSVEALLECGRVHQIDNIQNHSSASASFSNSRCALVCVLANVILPEDSIHEGQICPEDTNGICRAGQCIGGQEDALRECGLRHHLDLHKIGNHQGTAFTNDQCTLRCVLGGDLLSAEHHHEGLPCPANPNGICRNGTCVVQSTIPSTITPQPTTVAQPSIDLFSPSKMQLLNISIESTDRSLNHTEYMRFFFIESTQSYLLRIIYLYGNPITPNEHYLENINSIPSKLNKASQLEIDLNGQEISSVQRVDLYPLFANFYYNHKLALGEHEHFFTKFSLYRSDSSHEKLMDVALRFTIVFSG